jgi:hypothetical protein
MMLCMITTEHRTPLTRSRLSSMPSGVSGLHGTRIVDLAAGTGKLTELFAARDEEFDILTAEPYARMRKELERKQLNKVIAQEGLSTMIPTENATCDCCSGTQLSPFLPSRFFSSCTTHQPCLDTHVSAVALFLVQPLSFRHTPTVHCGTDHAFSL